MQAIEDWVAVECQKLVVKGVHHVGPERHGGGKIDRVRRVRRMLAPCDDELIEGYAVSPLVNSAKNDGPELVNRAA